MNGYDYKDMRDRQAERAKQLHVINPYSVDGAWSGLSTAQMYRQYRKVQTAVNQQFREYEKKGIEGFSPQYQKVLNDPSMRMSRSGNVGYPLLGQREMKKMSESTKRAAITREYKRVFDAYTSKTYSTKELKNYISENLSHLGIDLDNKRWADITKGQAEGMKKALSDYWKLYNEIKDQGLLEEFNLKSDVVQDIVQEYIEDYKDPKRGRKLMVASVKDKLRKIKKTHMYDPNFDEAIYDDIVGEEDIDALTSASDRLLYLLTKKGYQHAAATTTSKRTKRSRLS